MSKKAWAYSLTWYAYGGLSVNCLREGTALAYVALIAATLLIVTVSVYRPIDPAKN